jgi:formylglycine-generating enzyme required for sulfatase activity
MNQKPYRYPGIHSFTEAEREQFFGRERETEELYRLLVLNPIVVLFGKSGTGKTSLLQAGISPMLHQRGLHPVKVRLNDTDKPISRQIWEQFNQGDYLPLGTPDNLSLLEYCRRFDYTDGGEAMTPLLLLDQFEELFTLYGEKPEAREEFIEQLTELLGDPSPGPSGGFRAGAARVVISLRSDYLFLLDRLSSRIPAILRCRYELSPLNEVNATSAITKPAAKPGNFASWPFSFSPAALEIILEGLTAQSDAGEKGREVEAFLLQLFCQQIERRLIADQVPANFEITPAFFGGESGIEAIRDKFYADVLNLFQPDHKRNAVQRLVEEKLISAERRIIAERETLKQALGLTDDDLTLLCRERLLREEPRGGSYYYELSHDTLLAPVLKAKAKRLAALAEQERLAALAAEENRIAAERAEADRKRKQALQFSLLAVSLMREADKQRSIASQLSEEVKRAAALAVEALLSQIRRDILYLDYAAALEKLKSAAPLAVLKDSLAYESMEVAYFFHASNSEEKLATAAYNLAAELLDKEGLKGSMDFEQLDSDRAQFLKDRYLGKMILLKGGTFLMQGEEFGGDVVAYEAEVSDFSLSKYETTVWQYHLFCAARGHDIFRRISSDGVTLEEGSVQSPGGWVGDNPVVMVSWYDAVVYANWLSEQWGRSPYYEISVEKDSLNTNENDDFKWTVTPNPKSNGFRLPTELEWEYAAKGGLLRDTFVYSGSNDLDSVGWYFGSNSGMRGVGQKKANGAGIYDMSGNVWEWCYDWYGDLPAPTPLGAEGGSYRVLRGGSWYDYAQYCRVSYRRIDDPPYRNNYLGFRLARSSS